MVSGAPGPPMQFRQKDAPFRMFVPAQLR
jgi:hypothetical protein